ncbi:MAG: signal peptide peptidase SppA [Caldisericum sp.]|jgi:protease-4|nr:signal peptide peptidase SppA [Caldisericum sp.]
MKKKVLFDVLIFLLIALFIYFAGFRNKISPYNTNPIAVIYLEGTIGENYGNTFNSKDVEKILTEIEDLHPKGVILRISSPGGTVYETDRIYNLIKNFKQKNNIKVYVSMGEVCASGGYYISMAGDRIYAEPLTETGSIGVIMNLVNYEELLNKIGINIITIKSGKFKDIGSPYRELSKEELEMFENMINELYEKFILVVKGGRKNLDEKTIRNLAQGQIYLGEDAYKLGLVDKIGTLDDAINDLKSDLNLKSITIKEYRIQKSFWENFLSIASKVLTQYKNPSETIFEYKFTAY